MNEKIGCVIMASGMARRFGSNKLLHDFQGEPVMNRILRTISAAPLAAKVVVTRHPEIEAMCQAQDIPVVLHDMPLQSDTVALGVTALLKMCPDMSGCMFAASDQPCLSADSVTALCDAFQQEPKLIFRMSWQGIAGNPVVFPKFTFQELLHLPPDKGGGAVIKKHPELVRTVEVGSEQELVDVDTPEILADLLNSL